MANSHNMAIWSLAGKDSNSYSALSSEQTCVQNTSRKQSGLSDKYRECVIFTAFQTNRSPFPWLHKELNRRLCFPFQAQVLSRQHLPRRSLQTPLSFPRLSLTFLFFSSFPSLFSFIALPLPRRYMHPMRSKRQTNSDFHTAPTVWLFQQCFIFGEGSFISQTDQLWLKTYLK